MVLPRTFSATLLLSAAALFLGLPNWCCAISPREWQPYREIVTATAEPPVQPAQYFEPTLTPNPENYSSVQPINDQDLAAIYCDQAFCEPGQTLIPYIPTSPDPVLASTQVGDGFQLLPGDLIWHSFFAGAKESRTSGALFRETSDDLSLLDVTLGGRVAVLRWGHYQNGRPLGTEVQLEGASMLRLNLDEDFDFDSADFRFGVPLIYAPNELLHWKLAYYHLSSHIGDEYLVRNPGYQRINFSRDVLVLGTSLYPRPAWRWYAELGWAFYDDEGSDPWEVQFGLDLAKPGPTDLRGTPFFAINGHLREEVNFGGNLIVQTGWLWRGQTGRVLRTGLHYYNGKSPQFEFYNTFEQQIGFGLWQEY